MRVCYCFLAVFPPFRFLRGRLGPLRRLPDARVRIDSARCKRLHVRPLADAFASTTDLIALSTLGARATLRRGLGMNTSFPGPFGPWTLEQARSLARRGPSVQGKIEGRTPSCDGRAAVAGARLAPLLFGEWRPAPGSVACESTVSRTTARPVARQKKGQARTSSWKGQSRKSVGRQRLPRMVSSVWWQVPSSE